MSSKRQDDASGQQERPHKLLLSPEISELAHMLATLESRFAPDLRTA